MNPMTVSEKLINAGILTQEKSEYLNRLQSHLARHGNRNATIGELAVEYKFATDAAIASCLIEAGEEVHLMPIEIAPHVIRQYKLKPLGLDGTILKVGALTRLNEREKQEIIDSCSRLDAEVTEVEEVAMDAKEVLLFQKELAADSQTLIQAVERFNSAPEDGAVNDVLRGIFHEAAQDRASDIHLVSDIDISNCFVSYRIDGHLQVRHLFTPKSSRVFLTLIKTSAGMDSAITDKPQDGRISWRASRRTIDMRAASLPAGAGESLVLRLLDPADQRPLSTSLRDHPRILEKVARHTKFSGKNSAALMLVTGPTGAGKSSFLHGFVGAMDRLGVSICTTEDPVEQLIPGVTQTSVSRHNSMDFADILRAQMRMDPDVLVIGEIRDRDTAEIALKGAQSGHFVVSTLHASGCEESVHRLLNMLRQEYRSVHEMTVANSLQAVLNLRLAPRYCSCATMAPVETVIEDSGILERLGMKPGDETAVPQGCARCRNSGFLGRLLVPEALFISPTDSVRKSLLSVLSGKDSRSITELDGVDHFSRGSSVRTLIASKQIDAKTAAQVLGEYI